LKCVDDGIEIPCGHDRAETGEPVGVVMQSRRSTPSRSVTRAPRPEVTYRGCGRTLKFALEVPPGMRVLASANNRAEAEPGAAKRLAPI
jgi:hypothetical protein